MEPEIKKKNNKFEKLFTNQKAVTMIQKTNKLFVKLPHLPQKPKNFIMKVLPWLVLVGGIIGSITVVLSFALALLSLMALDVALIFSMTGSFLLVLLNTLFLVKAFKPLRKNNAVGWIYLFWANILGVLNSTMSIINGDISGLGQILLTVFLTLLGFYLLFEIGPYYMYEKE